MEHGRLAMVNICEQSLLEAKTPEFQSTYQPHEFKRPSRPTTQSSNNPTKPKLCQRTDAPLTMTIDCPLVHLRMCNIC